MHADLKTMLYCTLLPVHEHVEALACLRRKRHTRDANKYLDSSYRTPGSRMAIKATNISFRPQLPPLLPVRPANKLQSTWRTRDGRGDTD